MQITTNRLRIRPYTLADAPFLLELLNSPGWIENIGDRKVYDIPAAEAYIQEKMLDSYAAYGHGYYLVELRADDTPIGTCGVGQRDYLDHPDIGFAFLPEHTGRGYAYEATRSLLSYARSIFQMPRMLAFTLPSNERSIRLLKKLGLRPVHPFHLPGDPEELLLFDDAPGESTRTGDG